MSEWEGASSGTRRGAHAARAHANPELVDRLPPHSMEAERGVLGCVLLDVEGRQKCLEEVAILVKSAEWFYDLRHRIIFETLMALRLEAVPPDLIVFGQRLKDRGNLDAAGGLVYVSELADGVPSSAMLDYYIGIVREKFVLRRMIQLCTETIDRCMLHEGELEGELARLIHGAGELDLVRHDPRLGPKRVQKARDFQEQYFNEWFGGGADGEPPGLLLPSAAFKKFPFKLRRRELTWFIGDKGNGKSTLLSEIVVHIAGQGEKVFVASFETQPGVTLKIAGSQVLGETKLPKNDWGYAQAAAALGWLDERLFVYNVLGIGSWREVVADIRFTAREWGAGFVVVDSVMRLGIPDDDLAQQGQAAMAFANLANEENVHVILVNHLNKSDRSIKNRSRGNQQWIDNAHNVASVERNEKKHVKLSELEDLVDRGTISRAEFEAQVADMAVKGLKDGNWWDANFVLHDQRYPGSRMNGSRRLFYTTRGLQYADKPGQDGVRYLEQFKRKTAQGETGETGRLSDCETLRTEPEAKAVQTSLLDEPEAKAVQTSLLDEPEEREERGAREGRADFDGSEANWPKPEGGVEPQMTQMNADGNENEKTNEEG